MTWIPVTERLPDNYRCVLVWCPELTPSVEVGFYEPGFWYVGDYKLPATSKDVTHWQELPEGPGER